MGHAEEQSSSVGWPTVYTSNAEPLGALASWLCEKSSGFRALRRTDYADETKQFGILVNWRSEWLSEFYASLANGEYRECEAVMYFGGLAIRKSSCISGQLEDRQCEKASGFPASRLIFYAETTQAFQRKVQCFNCLSHPSMGCWCCRRAASSTYFVIKSEEFPFLSPNGSERFLKILTNLSTFL